MGVCPDPHCAWVSGMVGGCTDVNGCGSKISGGLYVGGPDAAPVGLEDRTHEGIGGHSP